MNRYFLLLILICSITQAKAQKFPHEEWHNGRIITAEYDTIPGQLKYNLETNTTQLRPKGLTEMYAFSSHKLLYFDFVDKVSKVYRQFIILPYDIKNNNYEIPTFFEIIKEGENLSLLTRERLETVNESFSPYRPRNFSTVRLVYDYYLLNSNGKIMPFDGKKRSLEPIFKPYYDEVRSYIREERLKLDKMADLSRIVAYYNQLAN